MRAELLSGPEASGSRETSGVWVETFRKMTFLLKWSIGDRRANHGWVHSRIINQQQKPALASTAPSTLISFRGGRAPGHRCPGTGAGAGAGAGPAPWDQQSLVLLSAA